MQVGDKVCFDLGFWKKENGIVKSLSGDPDFVYVVYDCNNDWDNYMNYTGVRTGIKNLKQGWTQNI